MGKKTGSRAGGRPFFMRACPYPAGVLQWKAANRRNPKEKKGGIFMALEILVTLPADEAHRRMIEEAAPSAHFTYVEERNCTDSQVIRGADIILGNVPPKLIGGSPRLRWIQLGSAGTNGYTDSGVLPEGALLTNATGAYGLAIAEHMLGMLLMLFKKLDIYHANQEKQLWHMEGKVRSLAGAKVVVVGLGDIGGEFAKRVKALGGYVIGVRRADARKPEYADELVLAERLDEVLPVADVVAVCLPGTEHTRNLINRKRISLMKKDAVLMNVGRGFVVDTEALCDALESGSLGGACLDVTEPEPLPAGHRLWTAPHTLITPHAAGHFHLQETYERVIRIAVDNLGRYLRGEKLKNLVDFQTGYRAEKG